MDKDRIKSSFLKKLKLFIKESKLIDYGETVLVAFSGGADSVSLLHSLFSISDELNIKICAAHINHGIRNNAKRDADFAAKFCKKMGIEFYIEKTNIPQIALEQKSGIEETARKVRYQILNDIARKIGAKKIVTAHNMNDNAETVIFNLVRGTGLKGVGGIQEKRENIIRPLLCFERSEIEEYLSVLRIDFVEDETNSELIYTRNFIRHEIIPLLNQVNSNTIQNIYNFSRSSVLDEKLLSEIANLKIDKDKIYNSSPILARRFVEDFRNFSSGLSLSAKHIKYAVEAQQNISAKETLLSLPNDIIAVFFKGNYKFIKKEDFLEDEKDKQIVLIPTVESYEFGDWVFEVGHKKPLEIEKQCFNDKNVYKYSILVTIDFDKINWCANDKKLIVRTRKEGDSFIKHRINRNVKRCFINSKIPKSVRNNIPVFCDGDGIIFVPYIGVADRVFTDKPKNPLYIYLYYKCQLGENKTEL